VRLPVLSLSTTIFKFTVGTEDMACLIVDSILSCTGAGTGSMPAMLEEDGDGFLSRGALLKVDHRIYLLNLNSFQHFL
jgi:hypothetical protein